MKVSEYAKKYPSEWNESMHNITLEQFQKLHQFIGTMWDNEMTEDELILQAFPSVVGRSKPVARFFGVTEQHVQEVLRIDGQENWLSSLGLGNIKDDVEELKQAMQELGFRVRHRGLKPIHADALANEYKDCDLQDMVLLLPEAEKEDKDSFYRQWDLLLKESSVSEILDVMPEILKSGTDHSVARWDEAFNALKQRAPFEQIYAHLDDLVVAKLEAAGGIDKSSEGIYPEDYMAFKEWVWEMFVGISAVVSTFEPRMAKLLEKFREDAGRTTRYRP